MKLFAHDLAMARTIYGDRERGKEPELTVRVPKDATVLPVVGDRVVVTNHAGRGSGTATAECEADVLSLAVVVRPDWTTYANPKVEREQGSLL